MTTDNTIPKNWKWVTIDDIGQVVSGGTPSTKEIDLWNGDVPWITPADLSNYKDIFISKGQRNLSQLGLEYSSATLLPKNSILFSTRAPIGYVAIAKNELSTNQGFKSIVLSESAVDSKYVYYYLKTIKHLAEKLASGTTFLELSVSKFKQIPFPFAPIEEQKRIVERIEELFSQLDKNLEVLYNSLEDVKNFWLLSLRDSFTDYNTLIELGSISEVKGGKRLPANKAYAKAKTPYPYVRVTNFIDFGVDVENLFYIDKETFEILRSYIINSEDIYISIAGTIGLVGSIPSSLTNAVLTENAAKICLQKGYSKKYIMYYLSSPQGQDQIMNSVNATSQPKLALYKIKDIKIPDISLADQEKICLRLDEAKANYDELTKTIKKSILDVDVVKSKLLREAFQGKHSEQFASDSSVESLLESIRLSKAEFIERQRVNNSSNGKGERKWTDIYQIIKGVYGNDAFSYSELLRVSNKSNAKFSQEFDKLLEKKVIKKIFDEKEKTIKYTLS